MPTIEASLTETQSRLDGGEAAWPEQALTALIEQMGPSERHQLARTTHGHYQRTAAAHADGYPRFGAELLQATSHDLRSFLNDAVARLQIAEGAP